MVLTPGTIYRCLFKTDLGEMGLVWSMYRGSPAVMRIFTGDPDSPAEASLDLEFPGTESGVGPIGPVIERIKAFIDGDIVSLPLSLVRLDLCGEFKRQVLTAEHSIPRGRVMTYSCLAELAGHPGAARAAGSALAGNPFPLVVPCHRTVRSDGNIGGFQGGPMMKRRLLEQEGVILDANGRVPGDRIIRDPSRMNR